MFRWMFLRAFGAGIAAGGSVALGSRMASAAETAGGTQSGNDGSADFSLGDINLGDVDVIDPHVQPLSRETLSQSYLKWVDSFVDLAVPACDFEDKAELRGKLRQEFIDQIWGYSRQPGYNNFMARSYGITLTYSNLLVLSILAAGLLVAVILLAQVAVAMIKRKEVLA